MFISKNNSETVCKYMSCGNLTEWLAKGNASFDLKQSYVVAHGRGPLIFFMELYSLNLEFLLPSVNFSLVEITCYSLNFVQEVPRAGSYIWEKVTEALTESKVMISHGKIEWTYVDTLAKQWAAVKSQCSVKIAAAQKCDPLILRDTCRW